MNPWEHYFLIVILGIVFLYILFVQTVRKAPRLYSAFVYHASTDSLTPFVDISDRSFLKELIKNHSEIRREVLDVQNEFSSINQDRFFKTIADHKWKKIYLKWYSTPPVYAYYLFPKTMKILDAHPEIRLAMFSYLEPGARIAPHVGYFRGCIRVHYSISTPNSNDCFIQIDNQRYSWRDGQIIAFDDTYRHWVENRTNKPRIILFLDIERKFKSSIFTTLNRLVMDKYVSKTTRCNQDLRKKYSCL